MKSIPLEPTLLNVHAKSSIDLRRELTCSECKRTACLGNCTLGHDYPQYKRMISYPTFYRSREQTHFRLACRPQPSASSESQTVHSHRRRTAVRRPIAFEKVRQRIPAKETLDLTTAERIEQ